MNKNENHTNMHVVKLHLETMEALAVLRHSGQTWDGVIRDLLKQTKNEQAIAPIRHEISKVKERKISPKNAQVEVAQLSKDLAKNHATLRAHAGTVINSPENAQDLAEIHETDKYPKLAGVNVPAIGKNFSPAPKPNTNKKHEVK